MRTQNIRIGAAFPAGDGVGVGVGGGATSTFLGDYSCLDQSGPTAGPAGERARGSDSDRTAPMIVPSAWGEKALPACRCRCRCRARHGGARKAGRGGAHHRTHPQHADTTHLADLSAEPSRARVTRPAGRPA